MVLGKQTTPDELAAEHEGSDSVSGNSLATGAIRESSSSGNRRSTEETTLRVDCWFREAASAGAFDRQEAVCSRLKQLCDAGTVADWTIRTWGKHLHYPPDAGDGDGTPVGDGRETYRRFQQWATANSFTLDPAFRRRKLGAIGTGTTREVITVPLVTLAVYEGEQLQTVVPHSTDDRVVTVEQCLEHLETNRAVTDVDATTLEAKTNG